MTKRFGLPSVGEVGGARGEDEEMGELPVIADDDSREEEEAQQDLGDDEEESDEEEDRSFVEAARVPAGGEDIESGEEDDAAEDSWRGEDGGHYDTSVELRSGEKLVLDEQDVSYDQQQQQPGLTSFEVGGGGDEVVERGLTDGEEETSFSFTRELSVEEGLEEESIDRELSCEPREEIG